METTIITKRWILSPFNWAPQARALTRSTANLEKVIPYSFRIVLHNRLRQMEPHGVGGTSVWPESGPSGRDALCKNFMKSSCFPNAGRSTVHAAVLIGLWRKHQ
jgi:hypothetical protein